jgi:LysR family glycine cleavage system transcriptional activator
MLRYPAMDTAARKLPPLAALRVFEAAGRHGSFTGAATELGITPSAVSHGVRTLEDRLGVPLFRRDARGLSLTPAGEDLLAEATSAFDGLARAMQRLTEAHRRAGLRISSAPTFAARWLLPRLPRLRRDHPGVSVTISTEHGWVELGDGRFDLAIRMAGEPSGPGEWHRLAPIALIPVAAPTHKGAALEALLKRVPAIHVTSAKDDWASWSTEQGTTAPDPARGLRFDTIHMAIDAAAQGLGVALARLPVCNDDLGTGRIIALAEPVETRTSYWLVARPGALRQSDARFFAAWLKRELSGTPVTGR